jgi:glutamate formiminotransferase
MSAAFWKPDFGPSAPHPTAGASAIGARTLLIAFNINLSTDRLDIAKTIAKKIRESSGGLRSVKALGLYIEENRQAQVSMNLTDYRRTPISVAFEAVREQAERHGTTITGSEIVGLVPEDALPPKAEQSLRLIDFGEHKVLESQARKRTGKKTIS